MNNPADIELLFSFYIKTGLVGMMRVRVVLQHSVWPSKKHCAKLLYQRTESHDTSSALARTGQRSESNSTTSGSVGAKCGVASVDVGHVLPSVARCIYLGAVMFASAGHRERIVSEVPPPLLVCVAKTLCAEGLSVAFY